MHRKGQAKLSPKLVPRGLPPRLLGSPRRRRSRRSSSKRRDAKRCYAEQRRADGAQELSSGAGRLVPASPCLLQSQLDLPQPRVGNRRGCERAPILRREEAQIRKRLRGLGVLKHAPSSRLWAQSRVSSPREATEKPRDITRPCVRSLRLHELTVPFAASYAHRRITIRLRPRPSRRALPVRSCDILRVTTFNSKSTKLQKPQSFSSSGPPMLSPAGLSSCVC